MPTALRETLLLVCGVLLGIVAGAAIILFLDLAPERAQSQPAPPAAEAPAPSTAQMGAGPATPAAPPAPATAAASHVACPVRPLLAAAGAKDGQLLPPADVAGKGADEAERLLVTGKEAAAAGQVRDAEVALLTSCRIADARKGAGSVEAATARYQLARHYASVASAAGQVLPAEREALRRRAQAYFEDSLQSFRATLGPAHEKTRFAAEGLAALQPAAAQAAAPPAAQPAPVSKPAAPSTAAAPAPAPAPPAKRAPREPDTASAAPRATARNAGSAPPEPAVRQATGNPGVPAAPEPGEPAARPSPSFDCSKARSVSERIICGDAELSRLDRDLGRLHARARIAAPDAGVFKRDSDEEWRRRESTCRDRECLLEWYAERRRQLQDALSDAGSPARDTAAR